MKTILKMNGGIPVVHVHAFVAGSGDLRRIPRDRGEVLTERKMQLPSVSVVQAGGLPLEKRAGGARSGIGYEEGREARDGLVFVEGQTAPTLEKSLDQLTSGSAGATAVNVTCFVSTMPEFPRPLPHAFHRRR